MVFLNQFEDNVHLLVFQKAEITLIKAAHTISAFWKYACILPVLVLSPLLRVFFFSYKFHQRETRHNKAILFQGAILQSTYLKTFSIQLLCLKRALTTGVPSGTRGALSR